MGVHDFAPPAGVRLKPGVLEFFKNYFGHLDNPDSVDEFVNNFAEDALFIHGNNSELRGRKAIRSLRESCVVAIGQGEYRNQLHHIYPLNQADNAYLYLLTGVWEYCPPYGELARCEFMISLKLANIPGQGLKIKVCNTACCTMDSEEDLFGSTCRDLGMFRHS